MIKLIKYLGKEKKISQFAKEYCLKSSVLRRRLDLGWTVQKALFTPLQKSKLYFGKTAKQLSKIHNINEDVLRKRLRKGWNLDRAINEKIHLNMRRK